MHDILALKMSHASTLIMNDRQKPQHFQNKLNTQQRCVNFVNHLDRIRVLATLCPVKSKVLDSQCESSPSSDEGSVGPDVPPDEFMGRYGFFRDEEGLETVETLQVLAKQVETSSSILSSNLLGQGFHSQDSGKCMELRPRENPKDRKERRQLYWRKVAALTGTSRPPTKRTSIHPQGYKEGRFSLDPQWFHRILDWAGDEFQPQRYPFADPRSTTKVKRPGKRAGVWVNTPKGGAAVTQGLNNPWHDDTIFVMCPHKFVQQVAEKAIWEGSRGIMIVPRHKNKE